MEGQLNQEEQGIMDTVEDHGGGISSEEEEECGIDPETFAILYHRHCFPPPPPAPRGDGEQDRYDRHDHGVEKTESGVLGRTTSGSTSTTSTWTSPKKKNKNSSMINDNDDDDLPPLVVVPPIDNVVPPPHQPAKNVPPSPPAQEQKPARKKRCRRKAPPKKTFVDNITDHDVLFGRGRFCTDHPGNRVFRQLIQIYNQNYKLLERATEKTKYCNEIVHFIQRMGGRFLKYEGQGGDEKNHHPSDAVLGHFSYYIVTDITARDKVSQAFRDNSGKKTTSNTEEGSKNHGGEIRRAAAQEQQEFLRSVRSVLLGNSQEYAKSA